MVMRRVGFPRHEIISDSELPEIHPRRGPLHGQVYPALQETRCSAHRQAVGVGLLADNRVRDAARRCGQGRKHLNGAARARCVRR